MAEQRDFDEARTSALAHSVADLLAQSRLSSVEMAFALAAVLRGLGEATYDKDDVTSESVYADYKSSPSWPAALIIHADNIPCIWNLFITEKRDPDINADAWKAFEKKLSSGVPHV